MAVAVFFQNMCLKAVTLCHNDSRKRGGSRMRLAAWSIAAGPRPASQDAGEAIHVNVSESCSGREREESLCLE
ncbi:hypothetical protein EYF80_039881 [Liparis tanakae]|uniref:Uncharacterized protein n=1 Tax=Liparis tanakae TaxID=230148 RepID=A0A4Z2G9G2_9TELE|nr:hypothetical protein EYF80_039881 [Liparis tanakae]